MLCKPGVSGSTLASLEALSVEPSVLQYKLNTHTNHKPSRSGTGYCPGKGHKKVFWALSEENLILLHTNNKGTDQTNQRLRNS